MSLSKREYYLQNRERILARVKARALAKRDEIRAYKKEWAKKNAAKRRAQKAAHYVANREKIRARQAASYAANPFPARARSKQFHAQNRERCAVLAKYRWAAYRKANQERIRAKERRLYATNPEKFREAQARRRAMKLQTQAEKIDFRRILLMANGVCGICRQPFDLFGIDFDHIVPLARGGTHTTDNLQATHSRCNRAKGCKLPEEMASSR